MTSFIGVGFRTTGLTGAGFMAAVAALALATGPAAAADLARSPVPYAAPVTPSAYNWTGGYVGVNVGSQWGSVSGIPADPGGIVGGVQAGYNWQTGQFVFGGEADIQASNADDRFAAYKFSNPWFGTMRGRAGFAMNNILLYGTAGLAFGNLKADLAGFTETQTHFGWTAGAGIEIGLTPNWSAKAEYLYVDLNDKNYALTGISNGFTSNMLRLGVNYRF